jgi:hypothetical protein
MHVGSHALLLIAATAAGICLASCNQETESFSRDRRAAALANTDRAACHARGGSIRKVGINMDPACVVRFRDAGKACSDSSDCEGMCIAPYRNDLDEGSPSTGRCQADDYMDGSWCWTEIVGGRTRGGWCSD